MRLCVDGNKKKKGQHMHTTAPSRMEATQRASERMRVWTPDGRAYLSERNGSRRAVNGDIKASEFRSFHL